MAPNLVVKPAFVRGKIDLSLSGSKVKIPSTVKSENIVRAMYRYLLINNYDLIPEVTLNSSEAVVFEALKRVVNEFNLCYSETITELSNSLEATPDTYQPVFLGVSNELFCEGISWSKIATFFVFTSEFTAQCLRKNFRETIAEDILDCCIAFFEENLERWVREHDGWESLIEFSKRSKKNSLQQSTSDATGSGWAKSVLYGTVRMLGTLAQIANSTDPALSFPMHT